jgi:hypothetical protein
VICLPFTGFKLQSFKSSFEPSTSCKTTTKDGKDSTSSVIPLRSQTRHALKMVKLRVATVQEHFCSPLWQLSETEWGKNNIELIWNNSGTGQMISSLDSSQEGGRKIDVAVALTEALIAGIAKGKKDYKLVGSYVRSPLNWAVITSTDEKAAKFQKIEDLKGVTIGISRLGSGSQTMALYMAMQQGWAPSDIGFKVNDTFENLRKLSYENPFLWEWVTTLPYVHSGEVRYVGNVPTPWPSWSIAASTAVLADGEQEYLLSTFLEKLGASIATFLNKDAVAQQAPQEFVVDRFGYKPEDVETWFNSVRYVGDSRPDPADAKHVTGQNTTTSTVSRNMLEVTLETLEKAGAIARPAEGFDAKDFVRPASLQE